MSEWHLLCTTNRGKVSILKNLDLDTARQAYRKLMPHTYPVKHINAEYASNCGYAECSYGEESEKLQKVDVLGPDGLELDPWFGFEPHVIDPYA